MGDDYNITYTAGTSSPSYGNSQHTVTIGNGTSSSATITLDAMEMNDTGTEFVYNMQDYKNEEFVDTMPGIERVQKMCKEYPALSKAYEQFKLIYKMTEQDYKGRLKERGIDDDVPF